MLEKTTDLSRDQLLQILQSKDRKLSAEERSFYIREIGILAIQDDRVAECFLQNMLQRNDIPDMNKEMLYFILPKIQQPSPQTIAAIANFENDPDNTSLIEFVTTLMN